MRPLLAAVLAATLSACAYQTVSRRDYLARNLGPKASFDLQCPAEQIEFVNLGQPAGNVGWPDGDHRSRISEEISFLQGAQGCGRRASYVYMRGAWVADTVTQNKP